MFEALLLTLTDAMADTNNLTVTIEQGSDLLHAYVSPTGVHRVQAFVVCLAILTLYDVVFARHYPGRWFNVHAFANGLTVIGAIPAMILWIKQPLGVVNPAGQESPDPMGENWLHPDVLLHPSSDWPVLMIIAVHTYHCLGFKLSQQDIFHHFLFVPTLGVGGGMLTPWGPIRNCLAFFISGLPGGIDYVMLVLLKNGLTDKLTCKRLSSKLNVWLRGPGCGVLLPATIYASYTEGVLPDDIKYRSLLLGFFACYNGLYYMEMSVKNYQMHLTHTLLTEEHSAEINKLTTYWQDKEHATRQMPSGFDLPSALTKAVSPARSPVRQLVSKKEA
eukprot:m.165933 g.165933  ORF g.165933 m.165933 type:complete len:332 (-) comp12622_c0_seq1:217-1212(-)